MAWNKDFPDTTTTIKNYPTVLTDNFISIEEADTTLTYWAVNLADRDAVAGPPQDPPATISPNGVALFSKQDANTKPQLYLVDVDDKKIQMTDVGRIGGPLTNFTINNFRFGTNTTTYNAGNIVKARGSFSSVGALLGGDYITFLSKGGTGVYNLEVTADVLEVGSVYQVSAIVSSSAALRARPVIVVSKATPVAATAVSIQIKIFNEGGIAGIDESFDITITGGV